MKNSMRWAIALGLLASACAEDGETGSKSPAIAEEGPLYAIMYEVYDDQGDSASYLSMLGSLDDIDELDPKNDREFAGGRAYLATYDGAIFVGHPSEPTIARYEVDGAGKLTSDGEISLANFGITTGSLDAWNVSFISADKAYLLNFEEGNTVIWDPTEMEIIGEIPPPEELSREGFVLEGSPALIRGDRLYRSFNFVNYDDFVYDRQGLLAIYDTQSDEVLEIVPQDRCPALGNLAHEDEAGNFYFSNWIWPVADTLMYEGPETCVLRINADEDRFDEAWELRYSDLFDGRQGAQFSYTADGEALVAVFNHEDTEFNDETDPWDYAGEKVWSIHRVNLETDETSAIDVPRSSGAFTPVRLDGRQFIMLPTDGWAATDIYEIEGDEAELKVHIPGWSYQFVKVR